MGSTLVIVLCALAGLAVGFALRPLVAKHEAPLPNLPVAEIVTAGLFALAAWRYGGSWRVAPVLVLIATLVAISIVDLRRYRIPDAILFPGMGICTALLVIGELFDGAPSALARVAIGALLYFVVLFITHIAAPAGGMGFGDVKLALLLGMFVGWVSQSKIETVGGVLVALFIGSLLGVLMGGLLFAFRSMGAKLMPDPDAGTLVPKDKKSSFPFGPALAIGALLPVLFPATFVLN